MQTEEPTEDLIHLQKENCQYLLNSILPER